MAHVGLQRWIVWSGVIAAGVLAAGCRTGWPDVVSFHYVTPEGVPVAEVRNSTGAVISRRGIWKYSPTSEERKAGRLAAPDLVLHHPAYHDYTVPGQVLTLDGKLKFQEVRETVPMERDPAFPGFPSTAAVTVHSEPRGARLYVDGRLLGSAPATLRHDLGREHFESGKFVCPEILVIQDGCEPVRIELSLVVEEQWRLKEKHEPRYSTLILLRKGNGPDAALEQRVLEAIE